MGASEQKNKELAAKLTARRRHRGVPRPIFRAPKTRLRTNARDYHTELELAMAR